MRSLTCFSYTRIHTIRVTVSFLYKVLGHIKVSIAVADPGVVRWARMNHPFYF